MAKSQEEQEQELMALNAQLDQQISAVEQHADSVLQKQHTLSSSTHHAALIDADVGPGTGGGATIAPRPRPVASSGGGGGGGGGGSSTSGVGLSPRVHRASRASAARAGAAVAPPPASGAGIGDSAAEKRVLNQQNQLRVQQLEIAQLKQELAMTKEETGRLVQDRKAAERERAAAQKAANELKRQLTKTAKELEDVNALCQKVRAKNKDLDTQVSQLRRDLREQSKDAQGLQTQQKSGDVRLNRALAEVARLKEKLMKSKESVSDVAGEKEERLQKQEKEIRLLERQRAELLGAFKKQLKLIDILKRQKMHIEAARLLSFTEEEFMKAIDHS